MPTARIFPFISVAFDRLSHPVGWILDTRNWMLEMEKIEMQIRHSSLVTWQGESYWSEDLHVPWIQV
jgi:hypothetical protein